MRQTLYFGGWNGGPSPRQWKPNARQAARTRWANKFKPHLRQQIKRFKRHRFTTHAVNEMRWRIRLTETLRRKQVRHTPGWLSHPNDVKTRLRELNPTKNGPSAWRFGKWKVKRSQVVDNVRRRLSARLEPEHYWDTTERILKPRKWYGRRKPVNGHAVRRSK